MSWPQGWGTAPLPPTSSTPAANVAVPSAPAAIGATAAYTAAVQAPASYTPAQYAALSPEQQLAIQQNWQQWQTYHQQYAQWHAQYGEQYQREMQAKLGIAAPSIPFVPTIAPYVPPVPPTGASNYSVPPPPPTQTTSVMNNPSICAVTANPPPPPPPPPQEPEKNEPKPEDNFNRKEENKGNNASNRGGGQQNNQRNQFQNQRNQQQSWRASSDSRGFNDRRGGGGGGYGNDRGRDRDRDRDNFGDNNFNRGGGGRGRDRGRDRDRDSAGGRFDNDRGGGGRNNNWQPNSLNQNQNQNFGGNSRQNCFSQQQQQYQQQQFQQQQQQQMDCRQDYYKQENMDQQRPIAQDDNEDKTPEERAFDEQFKKWEEEFENWKRQNANHPDRKAYKEYEMKFEDCRRKLLERRELMRKRKLERKMKEEQERNERNSALAPPPNLPEINDPEDNENIQNIEEEPPQTTDQQPEEAAAPPEPSIPVEDNETESVFLSNTKSEGIPGLDLVEDNVKAPDEKPNEVTEVIDLDADTKPSNAPVVPTEPTSNFTNVMPSTDASPVPQELAKKEIPSLMSQKFDMPEMSPPGNKLEKRIEMNRNYPNQHGSNEGFTKFLENNRSISADQRGNESNNFGNDSNNFGNDSNNFGNDSNNFGNDSSNFDGQSNNFRNESNNFANNINEQGNMPHGINNLANALSDPNVLALITAAIGNNAGPGVGVGGNFNPNMDRRGGGPGISPWMSGLAPFQNQNQNQNHFNNRRDFGGNQSNAGIWHDNNQSRYNTPWGNRNAQDSRWGNHGQNNSMRQDNFRRGGNSRWQDDGDEWRNSPWGDDRGLDRNNAPPNLVDERSRSSERLLDKDKINPFKDQDDRSSGRFNPFSGGNDRGRRFNRDDQRDRSRSNNSGSRDRSRSSGRSSRQDGSTTSGNRRNPFKSEPNVFDRSQNSPFPSRGGGEPQQQIMNDPYFGPTRVIDYQNRPLGMNNENNDVLLPTKVVDYGHGGGGTTDGQEENKDFLPMTTIDYGHSSANKAENSTQNPIQNLNQNQNECQNPNPNSNPNPNLNPNQNQIFNEGRKNDFNSNRRRNRNRRNRRSGLKDNFSTRSDPWQVSTPDMAPISIPVPPPPLFGNREESYNNELSVKPEYAVNIPPEHDANENPENLEEISEDDNDFGESEVAYTSVYEEFHRGADPIVEIQKPAAVFPINVTAPCSQIVEKNVKLINKMDIKNIISIDEILFNPGRQSRPKKIVIIVRGPPGSGKSYLAKLIKEKEVEMSGSAPRILSIDDYFMTEVDKAEKCAKSGRKVTRKEMVYEYEKEMEKSYMSYLIKSFKKTVSEHLFNFVIVDCINNTLKTITEFYEIAKTAQFTFYVIDLLCDLETCLNQNIHNRSIEDIKEILDTWQTLPDNYVQLDITCFLQNDAIQEVEMEDVSLEECDGSDGNDQNEADEEQAEGFVEIVDFFKSKWDTDAKEEKLARLDGTSKPLQKSVTTLEDYLQMDGWEPPPSSSKNKKRVRWADIEEKRAQDKMRAIGFVVGQTDWNRMMDPTGGSAALTKTKYIEKVKRNN